MLSNPISTSKVSSFNSQEDFFVTLAQIITCICCMEFYVSYLKFITKKTFIEVIIMMY